MTHTHLLTPPAFAVTLPSGFSFDMMNVPGGTFMMGSEERDNEKPVHRVTLSPFYMGRYPVTQALYEAVLGLRPSYFSGPDRPVEGVSWFDAAVFCNKLSDMTGRTPCYYADAEYKTVYGKTAEGYVLTNEGEVHRNPKADGFRLPTEAEWEYAARGGPAAPARPRYQYAGGNRLESVGWYSKNSHRETKPVGLKYPNELGLYDMSGNVWERCEDWYDGAFYQHCVDEGLELNPVNLKKEPDRVVRGGGCYYYAVYCRAASRNYYWPNYRYFKIGFRLVLSASEF